MSLLSCFGRKSSNHRYEEYIDCIDMNNSDLVDVPLHIFLYERTLEKLLLSSNHVRKQNIYDSFNNKSKRRYLTNFCYFLKVFIIFINSCLFISLL